MSEVGTVKVKYECVDGMHFFTSGDAWTKGLCAASDDIKVAFDEVSVQCVYLLKKNHGIEAEVVPSQPFEEFEESLQSVKNVEKPSFKPIPSAWMEWKNNELMAA